jgi:hypothetical protein
MKRGATRFYEAAVFTFFAFFWDSTETPSPPLRFLRLSFSFSLSSACLSSSGSGGGRSPGSPYGRKRCLSTSSGYASRGGFWNEACPDRVGSAGRAETTRCRVTGFGATGCAREDGKKSGRIGCCTHRGRAFLLFACKAGARRGC